MPRSIYRLGFIYIIYEEKKKKNFPLINYCVLWIHYFKIVYIIIVGKNKNYIKLQPTQKKIVENQTNTCMTRAAVFHIHIQVTFKYNAILAWYHMMLYAYNNNYYYLQLVNVT